MCIFPFRSGRRLAIAFCLVAASAASMAETFPSKPITIRIGFPAGGPADAAIRSASVVLQKAIAQPLVMENAPGANGSLAAMSVLNAPPDGYTLLGTTGSDFLLAPLSMASAKYTFHKFKLIGVVGISDFILVANPSLSFKSLEDLMKAAKARNRPQLSIAHWGPGSTPHIVAADFQARTGVRFLEVPYKGAAPVITALGGSQVDLSFVPLGGSVLSLIQAGRMKPIALAAARRNPALPDVPTINESLHVKGFEYAVWSALLAPAATPEPVVTKLTEAMTQWINSPENLARITANASRKLDPMSTQQAAAFLQDENRKLTSVAKTLKQELQ